MSFTILIVDDEERARKNYATFLSDQGYSIIEAETLGEARKVLNQNDADIVVLDVKLDDGYGPALLKETAHIPNRPPIILVTGFAEIEMAVDAMRDGAHYFLQKPVNLEKLLQEIKRAEEVVAMRRELNHYRQAQQAQYNFISGTSEAMQTLLSHAQRAASSPASVLLTGETGTGKEVIANAIHKAGPRAEKLFVPINCSAIPNDTLESQLFGHEAGSFTGADKRHIGFFETADGGVLFLDELSAMPLSMQAKLLRALEERKFYRMGGTKLIDVNVQVIAATNVDLPELINQKLFREDLFYRLNVINLRIPPLRERKQDIPDLIGFFIRELNPQNQLNIQGITPYALELLMEHDWPGNIRELRNIIERAMLFCDDDNIDVPHLPLEFTQKLKA